MNNDKQHSNQSNREEYILPRSVIEHIEAVLPAGGNHLIMRHLVERESDTKGMQPVRETGV